jgi:hypothetical protein
MRIPYDQPAPLGSAFVELTPDIVAAITVTVSEGWQQALAFEDVNAEAGEVTMTERLRDGMRVTLKAKDHPWGKQLMILPGTESRSSPSVILPDGRTDIPIVALNIFLRTQEHDPHAILECKRISGTDTHLCREYVVEGMDRFRLGKYGSNHAVGFLVGYVLSGSQEEAVDGVNGYLSRVSRMPEHLSPENLSSNVPTWLSQHTRSGALPPMTLHHSFLSVISVAA